MRRPTLETLIAAAIALTLVTNVLRSSSIVHLVHWPAFTGRWVALGVLLALSLAALALHVRPPLALAPRHLAAAGLVVLSLVSTLWTLDPSGTLKRAVSLGVVFAIVIALDLAFPAPAERARLLDGVVLGAGAIAVGGFVLLALDSERAIQAATEAVDGISHYRGLGGNPNTVSLLAAIALPVAAEVGAGRRGLARWNGGVAAAALLATVLAAGSRGAILAALAACAVYGVLGRADRKRRLLAVAAAALLLAAGGVHALRAPASAAAATGADVPANPGRLEDELGNPATDPDVSWIERSGRLSALRGGLEQGLERPLLGHGFAMEEAAFVDRYYAFQGRFVESSYVSAFLELGVVGLAVLLALLVLVLRGPPLGTLGAACVAATVAGAALAVIQSYLLVVGNVAMLAFWVCAFGTPRVRDRRLRLRPTWLAVTALAFVAVVLAGRWQAGRALDEQRDGIARVRALAPAELDDPRLSAYRMGVGSACLLYRDERGNPYAIELCFNLDHAGREGYLFEAIDRRDPARPRFWSLRPDPEAAHITTDPAALEDLLRRLGAIDYAIKETGSYPIAIGGGTVPVLVTRR